MHILKNQKGQGLIEYLIIVALVGVATIAVMRIIGQNVKGQFANISNAIQGKEVSVHLDKAGEAQYRNSDLGNFFHGVGHKGAGVDVNDVGN